MALAGGAPRIATAILLSALVIAVYWPARQHEWLNYDDDVYVLENPIAAEGLGAATVRDAFLQSRGGNWHPLTWLSHALDVELFGLEPSGHHATSLLLHTASALLLFVLARRACTV